MPKKRRRTTSVAKKLSAIETQISSLKKTEQKILQEEQKVEQKEQEIKAEEQKIEKVLFKLGEWEFKRKHLLELIKGVAGSFLGVGLGTTLLNKEIIAAKLSWWNVSGILLFIFAISWLLIYKNEKQYVKKEGLAVVWRKLILLYGISLVIEFLALWLFASLPPEMATLVKVLVIGSYAAMAGAVSFSLI
ncbi:DUF2391 family protein [Candidatus Woesearchaeota archaeon]|nr:DUF2391 family protein [Candidatus Woesearchaeota archaeon]